MVKFMWGKPATRKLWLFADNGPTKIELGEALVYGLLIGNCIIGVVVDRYRDWETDRKSTRLNSSHSAKSRMPSSA